MKVLIISNDVVPGFNLPVAAPGIRSYGLFKGLKKHGLEARLCVPMDLINKVNRSYKNILLSQQEDVDVLDYLNLSEYINELLPDAIIICNSNQFPRLSHKGEKLINENIKVIYDFFAPKMLELSYEHMENFPEKKLSELRGRKIKALQNSDGIIVNGIKKMPYVIAWLTLMSKDFRNIPVENVVLSIEDFTQNSYDYDKKIKFIISGYTHAWDESAINNVHIGSLMNKKSELHILQSAHWSSGKDMNKVKSSINEVVSHPILDFSSFVSMMSEMHVSLDFFKKNIEREYAMVTRTVVSLSCGVPVVHPDYTELSKLILEYDAGWIYKDENEVDSIIKSILKNPAQLKTKHLNAQKLYHDHFEPMMSTFGLVNMLNSLLSTNK